MNKPLPILFILIFAAQISHAQFFKSFGLKAAYTSANQTSSGWHDETYKFNRKSGVSAAIFAEWLNLSYFSLVTQIEYAQRGTRNTFLWPNIEPAPLRYVTVDNRLDYLSALPLVKVAVPLTPVRPYIFAGPRFDFLLGFKSTLGGYGYDDLYNSFKKSTVGASLGLGVQLVDILPVQVTIEGRYNADLSSALPDSRTNFRNNAYDIWLGFAM
jgi:hypothetical protein